MSQQTVLLNQWNGIPTGRCVNSTEQIGAKVCEIAAWCPVERDYIKFVASFKLFSFGGFYGHFFFLF
jgi:hypothetical protein